MYTIRIFLVVGLVGFSSCLASNRQKRIKERLVIQVDFNKNQLFADTQLETPNIENPDQALEAFSTNKRYYKISCALKAYMGMNVSHCTPEDIADGKKIIKRIGAYTGITIVSLLTLLGGRNLLKAHIKRNDVLHDLIINGNNQIAYALIKAGLAHVGQREVKDGDEQTALHVAAQYNNLPMVQFLIDQGADPNAASLFGNRPIHYTTDSVIIGQLIAAGADPNTANASGINPFYQAVQEGNVIFINAMISVGLDKFNLSQEVKTKALKYQSQTGDC